VNYEIRAAAARDLDDAAARYSEKPNSRNLAVAGPMKGVHLVVSAGA
jgi:hypothetical protein